MPGTKRSAVWSYFTPDNKDVAHCDICGKPVRYCGNTTNLYKHIKTHGSQNSELQKKRRGVEDGGGENTGGESPPLHQRQKDMFMQALKVSDHYPVELELSCCPPRQTSTMQGRKAAFGQPSAETDGLPTRDPGDLMEDLQMDVLRMKKENLQLEQEKLHLEIKLLKHKVAEIENK